MTLETGGYRATTPSHCHLSQWGKWQQQQAVIINMALPVEDDDSGFHSYLLKAEERGDSGILGSIPSSGGAFVIVIINPYYVHPLPGCPPPSASHPSAFQPGSYLLLHVGWEPVVETSRAQKRASPAFSSSAYCSNSNQQPGEATAEQVLLRPRIEHAQNTQNVWRVQLPKSKQSPLGTRKKIFQELITWPKLGEFSPGKQKAQLGYHDDLPAEFPSPYPTTQIPELLNKMVRNFFNLDKTISFSPNLIFRNC